MSDRRTTGKELTAILLAMDILGVSRNHAAFRRMIQATESAHCCSHSVSSQAIAGELLSWYKVGIVSRLEAEVLSALRRQGLVFRLADQDCDASHSIIQL